MAVSDKWQEFGANRVAETGSNWYHAASGEFDGYTGTWHKADNGLNWTTAVWNNLVILDDCVSDGSCP